MKSIDNKHSLKIAKWTEMLCWKFELSNFYKHVYNVKLYKNIQIDNDILYLLIKTT